MSDGHDSIILFSRALVYHIVISHVFRALSDLVQFPFSHLLYLSAHAICIYISFCWSLMSGRRIFLLSRGLLTPSHPFRSLYPGRGRLRRILGAVSCLRGLGCFRCGRHLCSVFIFSLPHFIYFQLLGTLIWSSCNRTYGLFWILCYVS